MTVPGVMDAKMFIVMAAKMYMAAVWDARCRRCGWQDDDLMVVIIPSAKRDFNGTVGIKRGSGNRSENVIIVARSANDVGNAIGQWSHGGTYFCNVRRKIGKGKAGNGGNLKFIHVHMSWGNYDEHYLSGRTFILRDARLAR